MVLDPMANGDTEEDEALVGIVKVSLKQRASISKGKGKQRAWICNKGKQRDQGKLRQQSDREPCLQIIVDSPADDHSSSVQPCHDRDDRSLPDLDPYTPDDFNVNSEEVDDLDIDQDIVELSCKNPTKVSEAMMIEVNLLL